MQNEKAKAKRKQDKKRVVVKAGVKDKKYRKSASIAYSGKDQNSANEKKRDSRNENREAELAARELEASGSCCRAAEARVHRAVEARVHCVWSFLGIHRKGF